MGVLAVFFARWGAYLLVTVIFPFVFVADTLKGCRPRSRYLEGIAWARERWR
jgi:hypothetical protein